VSGRTFGRTSEREDMRSEHSEHSQDSEESGGLGLGGLLRSLIKGIPFCEAAETEETLRFPRPSASTITINNANGRTRLRGEDRDDIEVIASKHARAESEEAARRMIRDIRVNAFESGGGLEIEVEIPSRWNRHGTANLDIVLPRDVAPSVTSANGKISLRSMNAPVHARSSNGGVSIQDVVGDIEVYASNAKCCFARTRGRIRARSSNGKIELTDHAGAVDASTSNGVIKASVEELGDGILLATSNGRIVLELPEEVDAEVDIRVENGVIRTARELSTQTRESNGRVRGTLGKGGTPIKLRTSNGTISLR
jgi:hypothetical protein